MRCVVSITVLMALAGSTHAESSDARKEEIRRIASGTADEILIEGAERVGQGGQFSSTIERESVRYVRPDEGAPARTDRFIPERSERR